MTVSGLADMVFRFNRLCEYHLYTAPHNMSTFSLLYIVGREAGGEGCEVRRDFYTALRN